MSDNTMKKFIPMGRGPRMGIPVEKPKNFKATWIQLIKYSRSYTSVIIVALLLASVGTMLMIICPEVLKKVTNEIAKGLPAMMNGQSILGGIDINLVTNLIGVLVILYVSSALLDFAQNFIMATVAQKISKAMRSDISQKINRLPLKFFDKTSYGNVLSRVTNDVDAIGQTLNQSVGTLVTAITTYIGALIIMFYNSWILALIAVGASLVGIICMNLIIKKSQKFFVFQQKDLGEINGYIEEIYSSHNVVKAYNGGRKSKQVFEKINKKLYRTAWKSQFLSGMMMPLMHFISNFGYVAVCVVGAILAMNSMISFGVIVAFMLYIRLFTQSLSQKSQTICKELQQLESEFLSF